MSTPVFHDAKKPEASEGDMQQRMQHMINLQNEEQVLSSQEVFPDFTSGTAALPRQSTSSSRGSSSRGNLPESTVPIFDHSNNAAGLPSSLHGSEQSSASSIPLGRTSMSRSAGGLSSLHNLHQESSMSDGGGTGSGNSNSNNNYSDRSSGPSDILDDQGVGKGTLYFNSEILGSAATAATQSVLSDQSARQQMQEQQQQHFLPNTEGQSLMGAQGMQANSNRGAGSSYGAVGIPPPPPPPPFPSSTLPEDPNQLLSHQQKHQQRQHPNPQHYTYPAQQPQHPASGYPDGTGGNSFLRATGACCSCIWKIIYMCFCCCSTDGIEQQQLHRSFCYGAIDGMLTGSGIVAAFCGMDVLAPTSTLAVRSFVVAFSAAACFADSLCMALGHVWTTHVMVTASARERSEQRVAMEENKAGLKGKLVDMLLERGMLKIDAMSLADTLEGYPDMFVDALVGDALIAGGVSGTKQESSPTLGGRRKSSNGGNGNRTWSGHHHNPGGGADQEAGGNSIFLLWKFPSYNQHLAELENEDLDPEVAFVGTAMTESRREGLFMMMGFSLFAVVPSLIYLVIPMLVTPEHHHETATSSSIGIKSTSTSGGSMSAATMMVTSAAIIMWCLGVWKSRFLDSNWMLFGIETVVVLLFCIMAAYVLGAVLLALIPEIDAAIINTSSSSFSSEKESL